MPGAARIHYTFFIQKSETMKIAAKGFNYSQDGPGNRLVYHLQGCNFACKWCSNADMIPLDNPAAKETDINTVYDEIMRSRMMFFDGGGVTFTGGECTLQYAELIPLAARLKKEGISVCIETNGSSPHLREIAEYVDRLIIDLKLADNEKHIYFTGHSNADTLENIAYFLDSGREIHIRIPLINGVNTDPGEFIDFLKEHDTSKADFEFLPYHEYGRDKWGEKYEMSGAFISPGTEKKFIDEFEKNGLKTVKT